MGTKKFGGSLDEALADLDERESERLSDEAMAMDIAIVSYNPTAAKLELLWKNAWTRGGHGYCPGLSAKAQANLKALAKNLGGAMACHLIVSAVEHWPEFRKMVDKETAFEHTDMLRPEPWFLLTNEASGVAWLRKQAKSSEKGSQGVSGGKDWSVLDD